MRHDLPPTEAGDKTIGRYDTRPEGPVVDHAIGSGGGTLQRRRTTYPLPERDGIYADLMLLDLFLRERARGAWPVSEAVRRFHEIAGPSFYRRIDLHFERAGYDAVKRHILAGLVEQAPVEMAGQPIVRTQVLSTNDGLKWFVAGGSWLIVRTSGTEPLCRVYAEATSAELRDALLVAGERLARGG